MSDPSFGQTLFTSLSRILGAKNPYAPSDIQDAFQKPSILLLSKRSCWAHLAKNIQNQVRKPMQHRLSGSKRWAHPRSFYVSTHAWTPARVARILARVDDSIQALQAALKRSWDWGSPLLRIHSEMKASRALASEDAGVEGGDASPGAAGPTAGATGAGSATGSVHTCPYPSCGGWVFLSYSEDGN